MLGIRIKTVRREANLTQTQFAERLGVKQNTVAQIEIGRREPSEQLLLSICREYGVDYVWLKTGEGDMNTVPVVEQDMLLFHNLINSGDEVAIALFRAYAKKFDGRWHLVREFLEGVLADAAAQEEGEKKGEP